MAFPFDALDLFLPEIAHWMAGRSTSDGRRLRRAGTGLLITGYGLGLLTLWAPNLAASAFSHVAWAGFVAFLFGACGAGLLLCFWVENHEWRRKQVQPPV